MRSPEHRIAQPRAGRQFQDELQLRYLSPGAFTVLPPDDNMPPHPSSAPDPYRLTPSTRRNKNQSFAIIGETDPSRPSSRSPSPTGRVSPFRGRGFNPSGSRFASPNPSPPPPEDARLTPTNLSPRHTSKIPQLKRKVSTSAFGDRVYHYDPSGTGKKLNTNLSQSLTNLEQKKNGTRLPQSPRKNLNKTPAFQKLSPIAGSSPEPSQSLSSPSRIPKSRSTPPSRRSSPTRNPAGKPPAGRNTSRTVSRSHSRNQSRSQSRSESRDMSPTKVPTSPTKIPTSRYRNVTAKVNTFNKPKPKVPPKPQVLSDQSEESDATKTVNKPGLNRKDSVNKLKTNSRSKLLPKTEPYSNNVNNNNNTSANDTTSDSSTTVINKISKHATKTNSSDNLAKKSNENGTSKEKLEEKPDKGSPQKEAVKNIPASVNGKTSNNGKTNGVPANDNGAHATSSTAKYDSKKVTKDSDTTADTNALQDVKETKPSGADHRQSSPVKLADLLPSTTTVVSSTTTTVTQPLKIDANLNIPKQPEKAKAVSPMVDGRILSATSVSNAMNRMNDSVLNTQTLMKDHGFSRLSPAANAIISVANESNKALDTKNATTALPQVEPISSKPENVATTTDNGGIGNHKGEMGNNHTNHVTHAGVISAKALEMEVQKNMSRLLPSEHNTNSVQKSVNDRIIEARTVVAADVKPIRITVREKPSDVEVQSGNVRVPVSVANGVNERPGLPPASQTPPNEPAKEALPKNACTKFLSTCKNKMSCRCCKKKPEPENQDEQPKEKTGCFSCLNKKKEEPVRITIEDETGAKPKLWDKLKCCNKQKVRDTSCFPIGKRKDSWIERRDSAPGEQLQQPRPARPKCTKDCCKGFLRKAFCVNLCCKKKITEDPMSRKASVLSKKKSLTPTTDPPPPEDTGTKIDMSLVEHSSHMKGAIPILPICLAWFCLVMNCIGPGTGTVLSGLFCLCIGKPRFSQKDGPKQRIGSFIINTFIGFGQFFTVLFCLVGWGWSIWWGVIMLKIAKKHKKLKHLEAIEEASRPAAAANQNHHSRDPERNA